MNRDPFRWNDLPHGEPVRDWDIVISFGDVRIMGFADESHLGSCPSRCGYPDLCTCFKKARITSPVLNAWGEIYRPEDEDDLREHIQEGMVLRVQSGKNYVLTGERRVGGHESYKHSSIFRHQDSAPEHSPGLLERLMHFLGGLLRLFRLQ